MKCEFVYEVPAHPWSVGDPGLPAVLRCTTHDCVLVTKVKDSAVCLVGRIEALEEWIGVAALEQPLPRHTTVDPGYNHSK